MEYDEYLDMKPVNIYKNRNNTMSLGNVSKIPRPSGDAAATCCL